MKYKIAVSGSAAEDVCPGADKLAEEIGREIVKHNGVVVTGATTGIPYYAARGAKEAGGISIGISPAASEVAHVKTYKLPTDVFDLIIYTGFGYSGRNLLLTRAADAVITICGRIGTLNEFTIAFEDKKPQGVLIGSGGMADRIPTLLKQARRGNGNVTYNEDPIALVHQVLDLVDTEKVVVVDRPRKKTSGTRRRG
jgi:uncharacterized protein (TIGR00725 family)